MTDPRELRLALGAVAAALDSLGVRWAIGGSLASAAHGEPRATNDVDIVALLDETGARKLSSLLGSDFYADTDAAVGAVRAHSCFNVIDQRSFLKIDIFVPSRGPLGTGQLTLNPYSGAVDEGRQAPLRRSFRASGSGMGRLK